MGCNDLTDCFLWNHTNYHKEILKYEKNYILKLIKNFNYNYSN